MDTNGVDMLDLKAGTLALVDEVSERCASVRTGEDVLVHEKTPDEVLVLPVLPQTGVLQEADSVVVEHIVALRQEAREVSDTNVLDHFERDDLVVAAFGHGDVAVVHAQDLGLLFWDAGAAHTRVAPGGLVAAECDARGFGAIVGRGEFGECTPAAANVEETLARFEADLLAHDGELVVLQLLERFFLCRVGDDAGSIDHAWAEEPAVEVITAVVVVADLLFVLGARVHDHFWNHAGEEEPEEGDCEAEGGPVMAVLKSLEHVAVDTDLAIKVHLVEGLHGYLGLAVVLLLVRVAVEG